MCLRGKMAVEDRKFNRTDRLAEEINTCRRLKVCGFGTEISEKEDEDGGNQSIIHQFGHFSSNLFKLRIDK